MNREDFELAKVKIDRVIRLSENFDNMNEDDFKRFLTILESVINIIPKNSKEKEELQEYLGFINRMEFKRYGYLFKGMSPKGSVAIRKNDINNMVWLAHSFLF